MGKRGPKATAPCGTVAAYKRHQRNDEPVDAACAAAWAEYQRELYARRRDERRAAANARNAARRSSS